MRARLVQQAAIAREKQAKQFARADLTTEKGISPSFAPSPPPAHLDEVKAQDFEMDDLAWKYDDAAAEDSVTEE